MILSRHRLLGTACLLLAGCAGGGGYKDLSDPLTVEDHEPIPDRVTKENARIVARRCLQAHRRSSATLDSEYAYAFGEGGFVQLHHFRTLDRSEERAERVYVPCGAIASVGAEPFFNLSRLREDFRVTLRGTFKKWGGRVRTFREFPELGTESRTVAVESLVLILDDAVVTSRLVQALTVLSSP